MTQKIVPNIWFDRNAGEAGEFYAAALPKTKTHVAMRYPDDLPASQAGMEGQPVVVDVEVDGFHLTLINSDDTYRPTPAISFILNFDPLMFDGDADAARAALDATWDALSDGGAALMPLGEYPFSPRFGWVADRYGVSWQLMLTRPEGDPRPFVIPQIMFANDVEGKARKAAELYTSLLPDAGVGAVIPRPTGGVMFGEFRVGDQWFSIMDSDIPHQFGFTPGVSLEVRCEDQAEIDRLWDALSAVPEAEACGWLVDPFGVSWQIVPANIGELLSRPGGYQRMLGMKKLIIADF
ncbi:VOC family protein [Microbacterium arabinogalactanolyticum]|uniref:VOC family protein n=1 Tax=Microbacterium arabinogalactanolyticum TaxID=69365 RepID=UPI0040445A80